MILLTPLRPVLDQEGCPTILRENNCISDLNLAFISSLIGMIKGVLVVVGLMILVGRGIAQSLIPPDMDFFINFSALSNSPPNPGLWGEVNYYRLRPIIFPKQPIYTNSFEMYIGFPAPPQDAWILEKQEDGSLSPVKDVTNIYEEQSINLTTNQVHSLVAGNWYVEVVFTNGSYLANIAPDYSFAVGPTVKMVFPGEPFAYGPTLIAPNNHDVTFVLDGSHCTDPFYLPMQYYWSGWNGWEGQVDVSKAPVFEATGMMPEHTFKLGTYAVDLQVDDPIANSEPYYFSVQVITPGQAVDSIILDIQSASIEERQRRIFGKILSEAAGFFSHNQMMAGRLQMEYFRHQILNSRLDQQTKHYFASLAENVLNAFHGHQIGQ